MRVSSLNGGIRYETRMGKQAQLVWKESILYETSEGEQVEINVSVLVLSHSRMRFFYMSISKSQAALFSFLTDTFEKMGGVPEEPITDNMKTVMNEARTEQFAGKVNTKYAQFARDLGFKVRPCVGKGILPKSSTPVKYPKSVNR